MHCRHALLEGQSAGGDHRRADRSGATDARGMHARPRICDPREAAGMDGTGHSREALHASIREATTIAQELERQAEAAQTLLKNATANAEELQQQAASAQQLIAAYQEQDAAIARALAEAERESDKIIRS